MVTQKETLVTMVRDYLMEGNTITSLEAINLFGATRLSAIIYVLRHERNLPIVGERITVSTRRGVRANVVRYRLAATLSGAAE